jgi:hypothetical protein
MTDIERWIDTHESELHALAERVGAHDQAIELVATLVLGGLRDDAIYEQLSELMPSWDGQHSPLAGAPELVGELRRLAGTH